MTLTSSPTVVAAHGPTTPPPDDRAVSDVPEVAGVVVRRPRRNRSVDASTALVLVVVVALWELAVSVAHLGRGTAPAPSAIVRGLWRDRALYPRALDVTVREALGGLLIAIVVAAVIAAACVLVPAAERVVMRVALAIYCLPLIATAPVLLLVLDGIGPRVALAALSAFFPILIGAVLGLRAVPALELEVVRAAGGGRASEMRYVRSRAAAGGLVGGMKIGATAAVLGALIGELIGAERGLGVLMLNAQKTLNVERTWGVALVAAALAGLLYALVALVGRALGNGFGAGTYGLARGAIPKARRLGEALAIGLASGIVLLLGWSVGVRLVGGSPLLIKGPTAVWRAVASDPDAADRRSDLWEGLRVTLVHAGWGMLAGLGVAVALAVMFDLVPATRRPLLAIAVVFQTVPTVAFVPLFILAFGRQTLSVAVFGVVCVLFPSLITLLSGLDAVSPYATDVVRAAGGGRRAALRTVRIPAALPALFAAVRIAVPNAITGALVAEWLATGDGLGRIMTTAGSRLDYSSVWAAAVLIALVSALGYSAVSAVERLVLDRYAGAPA